MMAIELNTTDTNHIIKKMVHDLRSPLACMEMIASCSEKIVGEEKERLILFIDRMKRILDAFVSSPKATDRNDVSELVDVINKTILEKQLEHSRLNPQIIFKNPQNLNKLNVACDKGDLERMLSNIINNATESVANKVPIILIALEVNNNQAKLAIEDNGSGIPQDILNQIKNARSVTHGKTNGSGIGLMQVRETMSKCNGSFSISSEQNAGTKIILAFKVGN